MKHNGWRKPTPGLVVAEKHAQAGERLSIPKTQAIVALKKVAAAIGLKAPDMLLLDTLAAITQPQDWEQGKRPIVWSSNAFLEEQTGFSLSALRRHVRRLCEVGVIAMKDSPNGKRWGKRDDDGHIVQAYGFDLGPMAARAEEFQALHARLQEERQLCASLRNMITVTRRIIRAKIEKAQESRLKGPWRELQEEFEHMLVSLPKRSTGPEKLLDLVDWFKALKDKVEQAFAAAFDWPKESDVQQTSESSHKVVHIDNNYKKMTPTDATNGTHIPTTNQPTSVSSNSFETKHTANAEPKLPPSVEVERPGEIDLEINWSTHGKKRGSEIDIPMLMASCPEFAQTARGMNGYVKSWDDVHRAAGQVLTMCGISNDAWNVAQKVMGPAIAAATIALIFDKYNEGLIKSPGGYLRGMVEKAQAGDLHLDRSFFGRLSETRAT